MSPNEDYNARQRKNISRVTFTTGDDFQIEGIPTYIHDRGELYTSQDMLFFSSKTWNLKIQGIKSLSLGQVNRRRANFTLASAICLLIFGIISLTKESWLIAAIFFLFSVVALVQWRSKWVLIEYHDENNHLNRIYLADHSFFGLGGLFGGTKRLHKALQRQILKIANVRIHY